jgi:3-dehydroquinate synthase
MRIKTLLEVYNLPTSGPTEMTSDTYVKHMQRDKKVLAGKMRFILPTEIGTAIVVDDVTTSELQELLGS